jgi:hypothetical protein
MFPEKQHFDGYQHRNKRIKLTYQIYYFKSQIGYTNLKIIQEIKWADFELHKGIMKKRNK